MLLMSIHGYHLDVGSVESGAMMMQAVLQTWVEFVLKREGCRLWKVFENPLLQFQG